MTLPELFSEIALELHEQTSTESTVDLISRYASAAASCDDAGILLVHSRRRLETASSTSERVVRSHDLQREFDEGPCLDALDGDDLYVSQDIANDPRWPRWGKAMADLGLRSAVSIRLATKQRRYGSLNLYSERVNGFDADDIAVATIFGRHASIALATAAHEDGLMVAIDARKIIGQAQGILMERFDIDDQRAFDVLRRYSQHHNAKLRTVAQWVVENRRTPMSQFGTDA